MIDALNTSVASWVSHPDATADNIGIPFSILNRCARDVDEFKYVAEADDGTDSERLGAFFAERYHLDVGNVASCVAGGDFASSTFGSTDFSMHSTGRPSSVHETGLLGFANEYYREMPPTSSTLQSIIANVLSGGGTGSRTTAIRDYIDGDYVCGAYADDEMDEKVGCFKLLLARNITGDAETFTSGDTLPSTNTTHALYPVTINNSFPDDNFVRYNFGSTVREPGDWVLVQAKVSPITRTPVLIRSVRPASVGLWMRYA